MKNKILGLDLGSKTLGVAMSDALGMFAHGYDNFRFTEEDYQTAINYVGMLVEENRIKTIVLGLPKLLNGDLADRAKITLKFKEMLLNELEDIEVVLMDERFTTKIATNNLISLNVKRNQRKKIIDREAAVYILQSYLDSRK